MPLTRLSIKSAIRLSRTRVSIEDNLDLTWTVRTAIPDDQTVVDKAESRIAARAKQRQQRIMVALILLGARHTDAIDAARAAHIAADLAASLGQPIPPWRAVITTAFERLLLSGRVP